MDLLEERRRDGESPSDATRRPGGRWWLIAGFAFAAINLLLSPAAIVLLWSMLLNTALGGGPLPVQLFFAALFVIVVPGLLAAGLASLVELALTRLGRPDRSKRWSWRTAVTALAFVSPFVFLPILFVHALDLPSNAELEVMKAHGRRPIVATESVGFCSSPQWAVVEGHPEMSIAVRVREKASYALMVDGEFERRQLGSGGWSAKGLGGTVIDELSPGVHTMHVRLDNDSVTVWPVCINLIDLSYSDGRGSIDSRAGDSLYILDETGLRP